MHSIKSLVFCVLHSWYFLISGCSIGTIEILIIAETCTKIVYMITGMLNQLMVINTNELKILVYFQTKSVYNKYIYIFYIY